MANPFQTLVITQRGAGVAQITMSRPQVRLPPKNVLLNYR
jgi:hypothetical protein